MFFSKRLLSLGLLLVALAQVLLALDLSKKKEPSGKLKVRLDYPLVTKTDDDFDGGHQWVFSTHLEFKEPVESISDGKLKKMALDAFEEMTVDMRQYDPKYKFKPAGKRIPMFRPNVMTIMAWDKEVILTSSQRGGPSFIDEVAESPVSDALERCKIFWRDSHDGTEKDHTNNRKCGEIMAFHQYYQIHTEKIASIEPTPRVTTVSITALGVGYIKPPCGTNQENDWGCNLLTKDEEVDVRYFGVDEEGKDDLEPEDYDLGDIAGGVDSISQIQSCGMSQS